jgi:DNA topoisomerase IA
MKGISLPNFTKMFEKSLEAVKNYSSKAEERIQDIKKEVEQKFGDLKV